MHMLQCTFDGLGHSSLCRWFEDAKACDHIEEANAMALATSTGEGQPSVRYVLLKNVDARGFSFYTNYGSRKAREMLSTGHAALCFYWEPLQRSVGAATQCI